MKPNIIWPKKRKDELPRLDIPWGSIREDGYIFNCIGKDGNECWLSPKARQKQIDSIKTYHSENKVALTEYRKKRWSGRVNLEKENMRYEMYGLTKEGFDTLWKASDGKCAICSKDLIIKRAGCVVDHSHKTGAVRGLLCGQCNTGIGMLKDSIVLTKNATRYLEMNGE